MFPLHEKEKIRLVKFIFLLSTKLTKNNKIIYLKIWKLKLLQYERETKYYSGLI